MTTQDRPGALVLGATGHIGNAVVRRLLHRGYRITAVTRRGTLPVNCAGLELEVVRGDLSDPATLQDCVDGQALIVDAASPYPLELFNAAGRPAVIEEARSYALRLVRAARQAGATVAHVGSFVTLPRPRQRGFISTVLRNAHPYFEVKATMEAVFLDAAKDGLPVAVVNPSACLGPWDLKPRALCALPQLVGGQVPAVLRKVINVVDVREVAHALVAAVEAGAFRTRVPVAGHDLTIADLATRACALAGRPAPRWEVPPALGLWASAGLETLLASVGRPPPYPSLAVMLIHEAHAMPVSDLQRRLGAVPRSLDSTLTDALDWYRRLGYW